MISMHKRFRFMALGALITLAGIAIVMLSQSGPAKASASGSRHELRLSFALLNRGEATSARSHALKAVAADPSWGLAHAVLARTYLVLGEGLAAQAALGRARDAGFDPGRSHHLLAHALLLQGQNDRALVEAAKAEPRYAGYAVRVAAKALAANGNLPAAQQLLAEVLRASDGANIDAWVDLGRVRQQSSDVAGAIDAAHRALALDRGNVDALVLHGELIRDQYGLVAALPWFETALKVDPWRHDALIDYAATLGDIGRYSDMLDATRRALAARPGSPDALYLQAVMAARAGNDVLAGSLLKRTGSALVGHPGPLMLGAVLDYSAGRYQQAIDQWRGVLGVQPMNIAARRLLGAALLQGGDARGALEVLRPLALRGDADSYTLSLVGRSFEQTGERDWAFKFLDQSAYPIREGTNPFGEYDDPAEAGAAAAAAPGDPVKAVMFVRALVDAGRPADGLAAARQLALRFPGAPQSYLLVGDTLMVMKRYRDAAASYRRAADLRFDEPTMLRTVDALGRSGEREYAATVLALFLSQNPQNIAAQRLTAHWQIAAGDWDGAVNTLETLRARIGNRDAAMLAELAYAYVGNDEVEVARRYAAAAYRLAPLNPAVVDAYGWVLHLAGEQDLALQLMQKAVSIAPSPISVRWHFAQVLAEAGRRDDAVTEMQRLLADPAFEDRLAATELLKKLR